MASVSPYVIPVETVIDFEDVKTSDPELLFVGNNNEKNPEETVVIDDQTAPKRKTIGEGLRPLLASMKLFGLYCNRRSADSGDELNKNSRKWNANTVYGAVVVTLLWINAVRMFSMFIREDTFGLLLFSKLIIVTWTIQCAISQTAFYAASFSGRLAVVFDQPLADSCARHARKFSIIYAVVAWSIILLASAFFAYGLFFTDGFY